MSGNWKYWSNFCALTIITLCVCVFCFVLFCFHRQGFLGIRTIILGVSPLQKVTETLPLWKRQVTGSLKRKHSFVELALEEAIYLSSGRLSSGRLSSGRLSSGRLRDYDDDDDDDYDYYYCGGGGGDGGGNILLCIS